MSMSDPQFRLDWTIRERRDEVRTLAIGRLMTQVPLWRKTWLSATVAVFGGAAFAVAGVDLVDSERDFGAAVMIVALIVVIIASYVVTDNASIHRSNARDLDYRTQWIRRLGRDIEEYRAKLVEATARERDERNLPASVDALLILIAAESGEGNAKIRAITGPSLTQSGWAELAVEEDWDSDTTRQIQDANAALARARRG